MSKFGYKSGENRERSIGDGWEQACAILRSMTLGEAGRVPKRDLRWVSPGRGVEIGALDGLRTIAIVPVIAIHLGFVTGGFVGVTLFFALSGYLIGALLLEEKDRTSTVRIRQFYVRRLGRLYPALLVAIVFAVIVGLLNEVPAVRMFAAAVIAGSYTANLVASVTGAWIPVLNHTWTLAQEEQFYLVAPLLTRRANMSKLGLYARICFVSVLIIGLLRLAATIVIPELYPFTYENPLLNLDGMLAGFGLALLVKSGRLPDWVIWATSKSIVAWSALAVFAVAATFAVMDSWTSAVANSATVLATLVLLCHLSTSKSTITTILDARPMRWLGQRVYGIYLFHVPIFLMLGVGGGDSREGQPLFISIALVLTIGSAAASARWVEAPVRLWVRRRQSASSSRVSN